VIAVVSAAPGQHDSPSGSCGSSRRRGSPRQIPRRVVVRRADPQGADGKIRRIGLAKTLGSRSLELAKQAGTVAFGPRAHGDGVGHRAGVARGALDRSVGLHDNFFEARCFVAAVDAIERSKRTAG